MGSKSPNFRCEKCKTTYYIKKRAKQIWGRYMPPRYCPGCGAETGKTNNDVK